MSYHRDDHNFFFNDTATTEIYTLSLHDALPIWVQVERRDMPVQVVDGDERQAARPRDRLRGGEPDEKRADEARAARDRKSTRLNSSHANISYAVLWFKKKNKYSIDITVLITTPH